MIFTGHRVAKFDACSGTLSARGGPRRVPRVDMARQSWGFRDVPRKLMQYQKHEKHEGEDSGYHKNSCGPRNLDDSLRASQHNPSIAAVLGTALL